MVLPLVPLPAQAGIIDDLKQKISDRATQLKQLDAEINLFRGQLTQTQAEKRSLQTEVSQLESTTKKLGSELSTTEKNLKKTDQVISTLGSEISQKQQAILDRRQSVAEALRNLNEQDRFTVLDLVAGNNDFSTLATETYQLTTFQQSLYNNILALQNDTIALAEKKNQTEEAKQALAKMKAEIADKKQLVDQSKQTKAQLLSATQNKEANYQALLADRMAKRQQVEAEINNIEQQIKIAIDPKLLPTTGSKTLLWPLDKVVLTQSFGHTAFSKTVSVYNGNGHNGIDLGTPVGTPLKSAAAGTVIGVGDTDLACRGASYGKWILIKHNNGLSTLYAHLSLIKVTEGQVVTAGQLIGYTGNTGYSTGPHLHFTVYASEGVKVDSLQSKVAGCGVYRLPLASHNSYLNPLTYLP